MAAGYGEDPAQGKLISRSLAVVTLSDCEEEDQDDDESEKGKQCPTWTKIPSFAVNRDFLDHNGYDPSAPYRVPPDRALLRVPPHPTPFSVMPSLSNDRRSPVFLVVLLVLHQLIPPSNGLEGKATESSPPHL
ncbi:hypothetical protein GW17_00006726 [Ensete ventricosum]|nr:hypothetical protein GW17_00006726 [Ensete ventricosum]